MRYFYWYKSLIMSHLIDYWNKLWLNIISEFLNELRARCLSISIGLRIIGDQRLNFTICLLMSVLPLTLIKRTCLGTMRWFDLTNDILLNFDFHFLEGLPLVFDGENLSFWMNMLKKGRQPTKMPVLLVSFKGLDSVEILRLKNSSDVIILSKSKKYIYDYCFS